AKADFARLGDRADFLGNPVAQFLGGLLRSFAARTRLFQDDEGADRFTGGVVGLAYPRRFRDHGMGNQRGFDLHGAHPVAGYIQHVVDAAGNGEIAGVLVAYRAVSGEISFSAQFRREVAFAEALGITPDVADHRRPGALDDQHTALPVWQFMPGLIDHRS